MKQFLLQSATLENNVEQFTQLFQEGADPHLPDDQGFTPLQLARFLHRRELLKKIDPCQQRHLLLGNLRDERLCSLSLPEFEQAASMTYLTHLWFESYKQLTRIHGQLMRSKHTFGVENGWLATFYRPQVESGEMAALVIRWIDDRLGYGLFAGKPLAAHSYIGEYTGVVRAARWGDRTESDYSFEYPGRTPLGSRYIVDAAEAGNEMRYINHSDQPNCEAVAIFCEGVVRIAIRTLRALQAGEQLSLDYGRQYWRRKRRQKVEL